MRTCFSARVGAVAVALSLTGAPALAVVHPGEAEHRCLCRTHAPDRECECARCHEATRKQREAAEAQVPPCHRAAVKAKHEAPPPRLAGEPCMTGSCGGPENGAAPLTPLDAFPLPLALAPDGALPPAGSVGRPSGAPREAPSLPETPPP